MEKDTEVIPRSQSRNEDQVLSEGEPVQILGNTSTEGFGEGTLRILYTNESHVMCCVTVTTPAKTVVR